MVGVPGDDTAWLRFVVPTVSISGITAFTCILADLAGLSRLAVCVGANIVMYLALTSLWEYPFALLASVLNAEAHEREEKAAKRAKKAAKKANRKSARNNDRRTDASYAWRA